jgi:glycosyltransferase involved in cell wall biosynthesis
MPIYNAGASLRLAIESIIAQDTPDWELLALNDGSTDESADIISYFAKRDSRIQLISLPHQGIVATLNHGLSIAQGQYIARMDADDYAYPQRLGLQSQWLEAHPQTGLVSALIEYGGDPDSQIGYAHHVDWLNTIRTSRDISLNRFVDAPIAHPSVMFRASCAKQFGGYQETEGPEDYELWLRWLEQGVQMEKVPEVLLRWNDPPERLSRTHKAYSPMAFERVKARYLARWLGQHNKHHRLAIWGAGRKTRKRLQPLLNEGIKPDFFIDLFDKKSVHELPVFSYQKTEQYEDTFVLSFVNNRGAREEIRSFFLALHKLEGQDFLLA